MLGTNQRLEKKENKKKEIINSTPKNFIAIERSKSPSKPQDCPKPPETDIRKKFYTTQVEVLNGNFFKKMAVS